MKWFFSSVKNSPILWLVHVIIFTFLSGALVRKSGECLKTESAKYGIVSLELALSPEKANSIKTEWRKLVCHQDRTALELAHQNIIEDMFFLLGYSLFFAVLMVLIQKEKAITQKTILLIAFALSAGILDLIENLFMLKFILGSEIDPMLFAIPASLKFLVIASLTVYLIRSLVLRVYQKVKKPAAG